MKLNISISEEKNIVMENIEETLTIEKIREFIKKTENINCGKQILTFNEKVLQDDKKISEYDIIDESTIKLTTK